MKDNKPKTSKAQMKATRKYADKTYKKFAADIKIDDYNYLTDYCKKNNISKAKLIVNCCNYCIDNHIDFNSDDKK